MDFAEFYETHSRSIFYFALRSLRDASAAQDLTQEVFLNYYSHYWQRDDIREPKALLLRMTRHAILNFSKSQYTRRTEPLGDPEQIVSERVAPENDRDREVQELLDGLLAELSPSDRDLILLRYDQGLTFAEIGRVQGLSETGVLRKMRHAERQLQSLCRQRGIRPEDYL
jgi:RNA polymerase sigma-70 factor (ECF subfamily)